MNWLTKAALWVATKSSPSPGGALAWLLDLTNSGKSESGITVTAETAQRSATVFACVQVISQDIAKLPLILYRRRADGSGRDRATDHRLYNLLNLRPNSRQTSYEWREMMQAHFDLRGNSYSRIIRDSRFRPSELIPLHPDWVSCLRSADDGDPFYEVRMYGTEKAVRYSQTDILHIKDRSDSGYVGKSCIARARDVIGLDLGQATHAAKLFANGARPDGVLKTIDKIKIGKAGRDLARKEWNEQFQGADNAHKIFIADGGMEYVPIGMSNTDAEFIEGRKLSRQEIAALFRVPPHMVGIMDNATFSNIEHQRLEYVQDKLMPVARRWEQALAVSLLRENEQADYYFEFNFDALLRGDTLSRYQAAAIARQWGLLSVNDWCDMENRNHVTGGEERLVPLNMWPLGEARPDKMKDPSIPIPPGKAYEEYGDAKVVRLGAT